MFRYIWITVASLSAGALAGGIGGLLIGWLLMLGYHRQGPSDPGDAPVYAAIGLTMLGAILGAIVGLVFGIVSSMKMARQRVTDQTT